MQDFIPPPPKNKKKVVDESVLWGYVPALDPRGLQRGLLHHGDPARLRRALHKLMSGEKVVVAAVGGSISVGRGSASQVGSREEGLGWSGCCCAAALPTTSRHRPAVIRCLCSHCRQAVAAHVNVAAALPTAACPVAPQGSDIDTDWPSYLDQFHAWLRAAFPAAQPQLVNKAQSGSTSNIFDACAEAMVPEVGAGGWRNRCLAAFLARPLAGIDHCLC